MSAVQSTMQPLGSKATAFVLPDVCSDKLVSLNDAGNKPMLVMFICNHCPFVLHIANKMTELANQAQKRGFFVVAISSNDVEAYPQDSPKNMLAFAERYGFDFPYLFDEYQLAAKNYHAACTPDFFVYDRYHKLAYRGQMDDARPSNSLAINGNDLRNALNAVIEGSTASSAQTPSIGCNIKWRSGNEPDYFKA